MCPCSPAGGNSGSGCLFLQQHRIAVAQNVADMCGPARCAASARTRRLRLRGDRQVERLIGGFDVLRQVHVRDVERVAVLVEAVRRAVGRQAALQRDAAACRTDRGSCSRIRRASGGERRCGSSRRCGFASAARSSPCSAFRDRSDFVRRRPRLLLRRHLAGRDAVVDLHPAGEVFGVAEVVLEALVRSRPPSLVRCRGNSCSAS